MVARRFVRSVEDYLSRGFTYNEGPPRHAVPVAAFLSTDRSGYCQQFSGAMALLLRMGGVPARVASGFAPGSYNRARREYVVKDFDAHSWVEAYFDGYGWITVDPTPAGGSGRARRQATRWLSAVLDFLQEMFIIDPAGTQRTILALLGRLASGAVQRWPLTLGLAILLAAAVLGYRFWRRVRLRPRRQTFVPETSVVAAYVAVVMGVAFYMRFYPALPFLSLFFCGYLYVGCLSLKHARWRTRQPAIGAAVA